MTKKTPSIKITTALLCDDARKEDNGKEVLIGVYTGDVLVSEFPAQLVVCLWLLTETEAAGEIEKEVRAVGPDGKTITSGLFHVSILRDGKGSASFALTKMPLLIEKKGKLKFQWRPLKGRWSTILTKNVLLNLKNGKVKS